MSAATGSTALSHDILLCACLWGISTRKLMVFSDLWQYKGAHSVLVRPLGLLELRIER